MSEKGGNFFEEHVEKMVLVIVGLVSIWFLITRVLISPNYVEYKGMKFSTGKIDVHICAEAKSLEDELGRVATPAPNYKPQFERYTALFDLALGDIDVSISLEQPCSTQEVGNKKYSIPLIGEANNVGLAYIRAVAYVPTEKVDEENTYDKVNNEPNNLDLVTVSAEFNVAELYESFYESFAGIYVKEEWRDPCLAEPVFASVQLARQELLADGSWSDWQIVPRIRIDPRREMFKLAEDVGELMAGDTKVRLIRFRDRQVTMDMLQPSAYEIASAEEEWFPPSLHEKYVKVQEAIAAEEKRKANEQAEELRQQQIEEQRAERERKRTERRSRSETSGENRGMSGLDDFGTDDYSGRDREDRGRESRRNREDRIKEREVERKRLARERAASRPTENDIYDELDEILITKETDFAKMDKPLIFWAHDDTVEPEKSYRYKIGLGVFNPIAGTNQFSEQYESRKNEFILWSKFSGETETVEIPGRLYFFPQMVQDGTRTVTVKVSKYVLGYWYSEDFRVKPGEEIGKAKPYELETEEGSEIATDVKLHETIDWTTGAVLVDYIPVNDWSGAGNLRARGYFDMLYSFDGTNIERMAVRQNCWAKELQNTFGKIRKAEKKPRQALREWGRSSRGGRRRAGTQEGAGDEDMERLIMERMMMERGD